MPKIIKPSEAQIKMKLQEIISNNVRPAIGRFHAKELDEHGLVRDLMKMFNFEIKK